MNKAFYISLIIGGMVAGLTAKILKENGIYLGFFPAVILWLACVWLAKFVLTK